MGTMNLPQVYELGEEKYEENCASWNEILKVPYTR